MFQLGGSALYLSASDLQLGRGETIKDTAHVLSGYLDGIMIRTFAQSDVDELARNATIPVINGLTDSSHPCQALADVMTIRERLGRLDGVRVTYVGDGNNVCASLMVAAAKLGMHFTAAVPPGYEPEDAVLDTARTAAEETGAAVRVVHDPREGAEDADVLYTDVWTSMGQEEDRARRLRDLGEYGIRDELLERRRRRGRSSSTACRRTTARRSPRRSPTGRTLRSGTRRRTVSTRRRRCSHSSSGDPAQGQRPDAALPGRDGRVDRRERPRLLPLRSAEPRPRGEPARLPAVRGGQLVPHRRRGLADHGVHLDVHARELHPPGREHALPLGLRQQRRGRAGTRALPRLLSPLRARRDCAPDGDHAHDRAGERGRPEPRRLAGRSRACSGSTSCCSRARRC